MTKRICDIIIAIITVSILIFPCVFVWIAVKLTSPGPAIYWSRRASRKGKFFMMPKFRTMSLETPEVATDKLQNPKKYLTSIGSFLRKTSLDELPQFLSVLIGNMSIVGPRPALYNQHELIAKRKELGIDTLRPGITGWAQINGRDDITLTEKIYLEHQYLQRQSILFDFKIIIKTVLTVIKSRNVVH